MGTSAISLKNSARVFYILGVALLVAGMILSFVVNPATAASSAGDLQLNLSHIVCVAGQVEIHFVLLNVPDGITPGTLTYTYGTIAPTSHTGNVWHYSDYKPSGYYDVTSASVDVNGTTVTLHNPDAYAGTYNCAPSATPTNTYTSTSIPSSTPTNTLEPSPTFTFTATATELPTATLIPTSTGFPTEIFTPTSTGLPTATLIPTSTGLPTATFIPTSTGLPTATFIPTSTGLPTATFIPTSTGLPTVIVTPTHTAVPTAGNTPTATAVPFSDLSFRFVCSLAGTSWRVTNLNSVDVTFSYSVNGTAAVDFTAPANANDLVFATAAPTTGSLSVSYNIAGDPREISVVKDTACELTPATTPVPTTKSSPVPTLSVPQVNSTSAVLIPVTGADFSSSGWVNTSNTPKSLFNFGFAFLGIGLVLQGVSKKMRK